MQRPAAPPAPHQQLLLLPYLCAVLRLPPPPGLQGQDKLLEKLRADPDMILRVREGHMPQRGGGTGGRLGMSPLTWLWGTTYLHAHAMGSAQLPHHTC